jgi:hypothetical protein
MQGKALLLASAVAVAATMVAAPVSAAEWWENTSISGRMYYDFTNLDAKKHTYDSTLGHYVSSDSTNNGFSFDIKRFYVGIDHTFNDVFSANVTTDFTYDSSQCNSPLTIDFSGPAVNCKSTGAASSQVYIKKAYLQAKIAPELILRAGSSDMPWVPFVEGVYGYRYVENTLIDRTSFGTSADWGAYALGKFADGLIEYELSATTGAGYKKLVRTNSMDFEGRINLNYDGFVAAIGGYTGDRGAQHGTSTPHTASRFDALAAYADNGIRVGVEYFSATDWNSVTSSTQTDDDDGYSAFASYQFTPEWAVFGRYDWVTTKTKAPALTKVEDNYYNAGIQYTPYKMINFALTYKHDKADTKGVFAPYADSDEVGLWGSFQW